MGSRLRQGPLEQAAAHGVTVRQSGPAQKPLILFDTDTDFEKGNAFCVAALQRGVYLHPRHGIFLFLAHREAATNRTLEVTDGAFRAVLGRSCNG